MYNLRNRVLTLVLVVAVMLGAVAGAAAQEDTFGLSAEDFAFWGEANAASANFTELEFTYAVETAINGDGESFAGTIGGSGVFVGDAVSFTVVGNIDEIGAVDAELRFVDEILYVGGIMGPDVWVSLTEEDMAGLGDMAGDELPFDPNALAAGDASALGLDEAAQQEALFAVLSLAETIPNYAVVSRSDEDGSAVYFAEFLLDDFVQDPSVQTLIEIGVESQAPEGADTTAQVEQAAAMAALATAGSELSFQQYINPTSSLVEEAYFTLSLGGGNMPFEFLLTMDIIIDGYSSSAVIEAPAEALPFSQLMQLGG